MSAFAYLERGVLLCGQQQALVAAEGSYTYHELRDAAERIAAAIIDRENDAPSPLAVYSPNCIDVFPCLLGGMRAGKIIVPANALDEVEATAHFLNLTGTRWLFYHSRLAPNVARLKQQVPSLQYLVCLDREEDGDPSLKSFMAAAPAIELPEIVHDPQRTFYYYATGGTTGRAKAVIWNNLVWDTFVLLFNSVAATPRRPVHLCVAPISHTAGPLGIALMAVGGKTVVLPGFDALEVMENIEKHQVTHIFLPPTALYAMLAHPRVSEFDYSSLEYFIVAAAPVAPEKLKEAIAVFGPCLCQSYGQSEAPGFLTWMPPATFAAAAARPELAYRLKSCGRPTIGTRLAIMNDDGTRQPPGQPGEIVARGNLVSVGYLDNPEATAAMRQFGWHHTGDIGIIDEEGFVYVVDRKKEMIISGGFNVYPAEVEARIMTHPAVQEAVVIGIPDEKWGEKVLGVVVLKTGHGVTGKELITYCKQGLGSVKAPKAIEFRNFLPRTAAGKLSRREVRRAYWAGRDRAI